MSYTLLILGHPRTGTTSLWNAFINHPEICGGIIKEKLPSNSIEYVEPEDYIDYFYGDDINDKTKVLIDGSSIAISLASRIEYLNKLKQNLSRICCIYTLRNPIDRLRSYLYMRMRRNFLFPTTSQKYKYLNDDCSIKYDYLKRSMSFLADEFSIIKKIETVLDRENMFICNLSEIEEKQNEIYEFLSISDFNVKLPHLAKHSTKFTNNFKKVEQLKVYYNSKKWFDENESHLNKIANKSTKKIKKEYGIDIK